MARFFMAGTNLMGGTAIIRGRDAEHVRVLRIRPGEDVTICDTQGTDYKCRLVRADKEEAELEVIEVVPCTAEPSVKVTVLCGLPKGDRTDYIIQKSVEAGAARILFFQSDRCVARPETPEKKIDRWQRIAEEAAKQSGRGIIPKVDWVGEFADALKVAVKNTSRFGMVNVYPSVALPPKFTPLLYESIRVTFCGDAPYTLVSLTVWPGRVRSRLDVMMPVPMFLMLTA